MRTYEKIETIWARDVEGTKKLIPGKYRSETVAFLKDCMWEWTEKIDGTNIRVCWDGHGVTFGGRTDRAQIPAPLVNRLNALFGGEENAQLFEQMFGEKEVILFGEGYGAKIQNGGGYIPDGVDFALFDVLIGENYQTREWVDLTAKAFHVNTVPVVGFGTLEEAVDFVGGYHRMSAIGKCEMEGLVCRPTVELRDRRGERVIVKIKWKDLEGIVG